MYEITSSKLHIRVLFQYSLLTSTGILYLFDNDHHIVEDRSLQS